MAGKSGKGTKGGKISVASDEGSVSSSGYDEQGKPKPKKKTGLVPQNKGKINGNVNKGQGNKGQGQGKNAGQAARRAQSENLLQEKAKRGDKPWFIDYGGQNGFVVELRDQRPQQLLGVIEVVPIRPQPPPRQIVEVVEVVPIIRPPPPVIEVVEVVPMVQSYPVYSSYSDPYAYTQDYYY